MTGPDPEHAGSRCDECGREGREDRTRPPGRTVLSNLLRQDVQAAAVPEVRELRPAPASRAGRSLPEVRERATMRAMREDQVPDGHADALRPGLHPLHSVLQGAGAVRGLRGGVEMALVQQGAGAPPAGVSPMRKRGPRDVRGLSAASAPGADARRPQALPRLSGTGRDSVSPNVAGRCRPDAANAAGRATGNASHDAGSRSAAPGWRRRRWRSSSRISERGSSGRPGGARRR